MPKLVVNGEEIEVARGEKLRDLWEEMGVPFSCDEGVCGVCVVRIEEGMACLTDRNEAERDLLGESDDERLACQCEMREGADAGCCVRASY